MSPKPTKTPPSFNPQEVWLAGLSAINQAQAQGQKAVKELVAQGEALQSQAQHQWSEIAQRVGNPFAAATPPLSRLEGIFEQRVSQALQALGVPTAQEVNALRDEIAALRAELASQARTPTSTTRAASTKSPTPRSAKRTGAAAKRAASRS